MENKYLEIIKYNDLLEEMNLDCNTGIELEMKNMNDKDVKITIKEYIINFPNDDIKLSLELYSKHFLSSIRSNTIFYKNKQIIDEVKYKKIIDLIENNINNIIKLDMENINSYKDGLQEIITIQIDNENYTLIGNTDNQEMKQLYSLIKSKILDIMDQNDRNDYFTYKQGDIQFGDSQCDFCKYNDLNNKNICIKYPNGKPNNIINTEIKCKYLEIEKNKKLFEKDSNEAYIRLIIPYDFVRLILPEYKSDMDLRGKKDLDLTTDEVIVLKKYNFEYFQDIL